MYRVTVIMWLSHVVIMWLSHVVIMWLSHAVPVFPEGKVCHYPVLMRTGNGPESKQHDQYASTGPDVPVLQDSLELVCQETGRQQNGNSANAKAEHQQCCVPAAGTGCCPDQRTVNEPAGQPAPEHACHKGPGGRADWQQGRGSRLYMPPESMADLFKSGDNLILQQQIVY